MRTSVGEYAHEIIFWRAKAVEGKRVASEHCDDLLGRPATRSQ